MKRLAQFRAAYRRTTVWFAALLLACLAVGAGLAFAQTGVPKNFDHLKTGFALTGAHVQTRCESCHLNGLFKGTPRDCASCHVSGARYARGNVVRPANHVPTTLACEQLPQHQDLRRRQLQPPGRGRWHLPELPQRRHGHAASRPTTSRPVPRATAATARPRGCRPPSSTTAASWPAPAPPATARARPPASRRTHMPTSANQSCDDCHKTFTGWRPTAWNHTQMVVDGPVRELPQRRLPAGRRQAVEPRAVRIGRGGGNRQLRRLPQGQLHHLGQRPLPRQLRGHQRLRQLATPALHECGGQAQHADPQRRHQLRELPHQRDHVDRREGRPQHLQRGDQLRQLPQRQRGQRQAADPRARPARPVASAATT